MSNRKFNYINKRRTIMPQNRGEYSNRMNANQQNGMSTPIRTSSLRNFFQHNQEILNQAEQRLDPRTVNPLNSPIAQGPRSRFTLNQPTRQNNIPQNNNPQNNNAQNNNPQNNNNNRSYRITNIVDSMERNRKRLNKNSNINNTNVNRNFVRLDLNFQPQTRFTTTPLPPGNNSNSRSGSSNNSNSYTAIDNNTSNRTGATKVKNKASSSNAPTRQRRNANHQ
jgi:hypothetical protein